MDLGFAVPQSGAWATPANQVRVAQRAEELGYRSLWTFQRLLFPAARDATPLPEAYRSVHDPVVSLAYLAAHTSRIRLGTAVLNIPFVSPAVVAKQLATLDIVAGGRLDVGFGLGWAPEEYAATGASYSRRGARAEEFLQVLRALWTGEVTEFRGSHYEVPPARMDPKPVQDPHPPVLLGATAEPALRRAGRLADGWISSSRADLRRIGESVIVVRQAAEEAGRDPEAVRVVCRGPLVVRPAGDPQRRRLTGSFDEIRGDVAALREQGVTELFFDLNYDPEISSPDADPAAALHHAEAALQALAPGT